MLQWGHDQLIVEGRSSPCRHPLVNLLQWGHDQLIVEWRWPRTEEASGLASMGPRSVDRGRLPFIGVSFVVNK